MISSCAIQQYTLQTRVDPKDKLEDARNFAVECFRNSNNLDYLFLNSQTTFQVDLDSGINSVARSD
jgi:hypothetical protein